MSNYAAAFQLTAVQPNAFQDVNNGILPLGVGRFVLSGPNTTLAYQDPISSGTITLTGEGVTSLVTFAISNGSFAVAGKVVALGQSDTGVIKLTGQYARMQEFRNSSLWVKETLPTDRSGWDVAA